MHGVDVNACGTMPLNHVYPNEAAGGRLFVDLAALAANFRLIAGRVAPARAAAVVKADAYGLGAAAVVPALYKAGCRDFFVAHLSEAQVLTPQLPSDATIYVLNGIMPGGEEGCANGGVVPVINSVEQATAWRAVAEGRQRPLAAVLQVDSGMSRLGVSAEDAARLAQDQAFRRYIPLVMVMSHLACAETQRHAANARQRSTFEALANLFPGVPRSLANSGAAFLPAEFHGEVVRIGIALYGGAPTDSQANPMRPVVRLEARVIQVRSIPAGTSVGYGFTFTADRQSRIATVAVGYADGWLRSSSNRGSAWFSGVRLPILGRVSMDCMTVDVTRVPDGALNAGDWVELIGPSQSIDDVAADAGTIAYEVLVRLGDRFHRVHLSSQD